MSDIVASVDRNLHARLAQWAREQNRPLSGLVQDILAAAERVHRRYDPTMDQTTRWIRMCRDGG